MTRIARERESYARTFLGDFAEAVALLTFVASIGCGALAYVGA